MIDGKSASRASGRVQTKNKNQEVSTIVRNHSEIGTPTGAGSPARIILLALVLASAAWGALACKGKSEAERLAEAEKRLQESNVLGATILYKNFLKKFPESPDAQKARFGLAHCYFLDHDYPKSLETLDEIIAKAGGADNKVGLNAATLKLDAYKEAMKFPEALDDAIKTSNTLHTVEPDFHQYYLYRIAELFTLNDRLDEALNVYAGVLNQKGGRPEWLLDSLRRSTAIYIKLKQMDKAIEMHERYLEKNKDSEVYSVVSINLGRLLKDQHRDQEADHAFDQAEKWVNDKIAAAVGADEKSLLMFHLADSRTARGKGDEARALYQKVIDDYPMGKYRATAMLLLGSNFSTVGNTDAALEIFNQLVKTYPRQREALEASRQIQQIRAAKSNAGATTGTLTGARPPSAETAKAEASDKGTTGTEKSAPAKAQ